MPKNPPVSDRSAVAELDAASDYSTTVLESERPDCALDLLDERPSGFSAVFSNAIPKDICISVDTCAVVTCDRPTLQRNWTEFKRTPPGTKRLSSEYGVLIIKSEAQQRQPPIAPLAPRTPSLAQQLTAALRAHDTEAGLDAIFDAVDTALLASRFRECDRALASVKVSEWPTDLLIGLLSITLAASHRLPARPAVFERTRRVLIERGDDAAALLDGLE